MILNKGLWISISLDGIQASISRTANDSAFLTVYSPELVPGDVYSKYGPPCYVEGLPKPEDQNDFAVLYRKLDALVKNKGLKGPYGEDHPAVFSRFEYIREGSPQELLELIETMGVVVRVGQMDHKGDDAEVEQAKEDFARWMHDSTTFKPNPKIAEAEERERRKEENRIAMEKAERWDKKFRRFVLFPVLTAILGGILWGAFSLHWFVGVIAVLFIGFAWWWIRR